MECLNSDGSATYLLIIVVEKSMPFAMTLLEISSISLNRFAKYF